LGISGFSPGLNVIFGENEAGKTTLLAFLRTILFGFPPGQRRENTYPPLAGGRHGGCLTLVGREAEEYVVTRHHGRRRGPVTVALPDGSQGDEEVLRQLTGAATEDLFCSIFAFSLKELQHFDSLDKQTVKTAIYSAGTGVGKVSLAQVEKGFEVAIGRIYKPGGKNPTINTLFKELQALDRTIAAKVAEIDRYYELRDELNQVATLVDSMKDGLNISRRRLERVRLLEAAWKDWIGLCGVQEELEELPKIEIFPPDGFSRLEKLLERIRLLDTHRGELVLKIEQVAKDLSGLEVRPQWLEASEQIRLLERRLERFSVTKKELMEIRPRLITERNSMENDLKELGPDWQPERLDQFDVSVSAREEIHRFQERLERAHDNKRQAERTVIHATSGLEQARLRAREADKGMSQIPEPEEKDSRLLLERKVRLRALRNLIRTGRELHHRLQNLRERRADLQEQKDALSRQLEGIVFAPLWPVAVVVVISVAAGLVAGWYRDSITGAIAAAVGLLLSVVLLWFALGQRRRPRIQRERWKQRFFEIGERLDSLSANEAHLLAELNAKDQEIFPAAKALGLSYRPGLEEVDQAEATVEAEQDAFNLWQPAYQRFKETREEAELRQEELNEAEQGMATAQEALLESEQQWSTWLHKTGLAETLSPHSALEAFERIRSLRHEARSIAELEERLEVLESLTQTYQKEVNSLAQQLEVRDTFTEDDEAQVLRLVAELEREQDNQRSRDALKRQLEVYEAEREQNKAHLLEAERELQDLFAEGEVTDEAEFRRRAHLYERRVEVRKVLEQHSRSLENLGGRGDDQVGFQDELRRCSPERLQAERDDLEQEVKHLEDGLAALQERHGRLNERREQLESAEELSVLRQQRNVLAADLKDAARRWSALTVCLGFFQEARQIYEKERKQPVVRESEHFFRIITAGRYQTIVAPHGEERIQVIGANGRRYDLDVLSRGTAEQLYLSLRFGYIQEFGRRARPLPVVVDDILVNFDRRRARAAISTMCGLAENNQILFFTCHPETVSLIKELDQDVVLFELEGGQCRRAGSQGASTR
jgi:uncharacterized protein YhaN